LIVPTPSVGTQTLDTPVPFGETLERLDRFPRWSVGTIVFYCPAWNDLSRIPRFFPDRTFPP